MKTGELKEQVQNNRPMTMVSIRMPEDVVEDLKRIARTLVSPATSRSSVPTLVRDCVKTLLVWSRTQNFPNC